MAPHVLAGLAQVGHSAQIARQPLVLQGLRGRQARGGLDGQQLADQVLGPADRGEIFVLILFMQGRWQGLGAGLLSHWAPASEHAASLALSERAKSE